MASNPTANPAAPGRDLKAAFGGRLPALVTLGLCIPIIALRHAQNMDNVLILDRAGMPSPEPSPSSSSAASGRAAQARPAGGQGHVASAAQHRCSSPPASSRCSGWASSSPSGDPRRPRRLGGALKWIDNFGIQILIYVMLAGA
jgi:branched-chain amino acid transport system permease protein